MSAPSIATEPGVSTWCAAFSVMTVPPENTREIARRPCAAAATDMTAAATRHATRNRFIRADCTSRTRCVFKTVRPVPALQRHSLPQSPISALYSEGPVPVHLVNHPLVHDALVRLRDKHT